MTRQLELPLQAEGEARQPRRSGETPPAVAGTERPGASVLMQRVLSRPNMQAALKRVRRNKGSPGVDGMTVEELPDWLREHWPRTREALLAGTYQPPPVKRQLIPKVGGGDRALGIPTVLDRLIQQALLQALQPQFDPTFSEHSHGFRPRRRAHDTVREAQRYVQGGRRWVVDVDLKSFFDRVNHDVLMGMLAKRVADKTVLGLIRRYLEAGVMANGVVVQRLRSFLVGWKSYFRLADTPGGFARLDEWIRHRLRAIQLKHWRPGRTMYRELRNRGMPHETARKIAANSRRWWHNSRFLLNAALPICFFDELGLPRLAA